MPQQLIDFIESHHWDTKLTSALIEELFENPPPRHHFPQSTSVSARYTHTADESKLLAATMTIIERSLQPVQLMGGNVRTIHMLYGHLPNTKVEAMKCYLFQRAGAFKLTHRGACSYRVCYAALRLAEIISDERVKIQVTSSPTYDQYVVQFGNKDIGYYVYDPLTNPELVFAHKEYASKILPAFPLASHQGEKFQLSITRELANEFNQKWPAIEKSFRNLIFDAKPSVSELLGDRYFVMSLSQLGVHKSAMKKLTAQALEQVVPLEQSNTHSLKR